MGCSSSSADDAIANLGGDAASIAHWHLIGGNGFADAHGHPSAPHVSGSKRQHFARALQGDRNQRDSRADRDVGRAFLEGRELAGMGSPALGKNKQRDAALANDLRRGGHGFHGRPRIVPRNGDVSGARQMRSEQRNLKQSAAWQENGTVLECLPALPACPCNSGGWRRTRSFRPARSFPGLPLSPSLRSPPEEIAPTHAPLRSACARWSQKERSRGSPVRSRWWPER